MRTEVTTAADASVIPVVDFAGFASGDPARSAATAAAVRRAFEHVGFLYLRNHGVPSPVLESAFAASRSFFALPTATKEQLLWDSPERSVGYIGLKAQIHDADQTYDLMEAYNAGYERDEPANPWPAEQPAFRDAVLGFHAAARTVCQRLMQAIAYSFGLPPRYFEAFHAPERGTARLLHYPPLIGSPVPGQLRAGAHTDFGTITLLIQDDSGGLEIRRADGTWQPATPLPGTAVVNVGDLLERWTNGAFRSTSHRVVNPVGPAAARSRYSCVFFYSPNHDALITCLEPCQGPDRPAQFPPILTRDHMRARHEATYRPNAASDK
jgi:isopenicillin N synthase-like dioxygenase